MSSSQAVFRSLFTHNPDLVVIRGGDGTIHRINRAGARRLGYRIADISGRHLRDIVAPDDLERFTSFSSGGAVRFEATFVSRSGQRFLMEVTELLVSDGDDPSIISFSRDTTELRESHEAYRSIVEHAPIGLMVLQDGGIALVNDTFCRFSGYARKDLLAMGFEDVTGLVHPEDRDVAKNRHLARMAGKKVPDRYVFRALNKTGKTVWLEAHFSRVMFKGKPAFHAAFLDITERKEAEEVLRRSEEVFSNLFECNPSIMTINSLDDDTYLVVNQRFLDTTGYTREEVIGKSPFDLGILPESFKRRADTEFRKRLLTEGSIPPIEYEVRKKSGETGIGLLSHSYIRYQGRDCAISVVQDITDRMKTERRLADSDERLRRAQRVSHVGDWEFDPVDEMFNGAEEAMRIWGYPAGTARLGLREVFSRIIDDDRPRVESALRLLVETGELLDEECRIRQPEENRELFVHLRAEAVRNDDDGTARILGTLQDDTERRILERDLNQARKMESIGRLAGGIAHDFNNLLTVILGNAELALISVSPGDALHHDLMEIMNSSKRASKLITQLLTFSRRQFVTPQVMNPGGILEEMNSMLRRLIGEHISLEINVEKDLWPVKIDRSQFEQLITNLVINARDAVGDQGQIVIEAGNITFDRRRGRVHQGLGAGDYMRIRVRDNGMGISRDLLDQIFEPFFTTKDHGTGLGLATCYGIVKQNGGVIWADSSPGRGTVMKFVLPRSKETAQVVTHHAFEEALPQGTETILVAEDEETVRRMVVRALKGAGFAVRDATNGKEALKLAEKIDAPLDLLLTDVVMPEMGGGELVRRLSEQMPGVGILYMSGYADHESFGGDFLGPDQHFIQKPFTPAEIVRKVRMVLDQRSTTTQ